MNARILDGMERARIRNRPAYHRAIVHNFFRWFTVFALGYLLAALAYAQPTPSGTATHDQNQAFSYSNGLGDSRTTTLHTWYEPTENLVYIRVVSSTYADFSHLAYAGVQIASGSNTRITSDSQYWVVYPGSDAWAIFDLDYFNAPTGTASNRQAINTSVSVHRVNLKIERNSTGKPYTLHFWQNGSEVHSFEVSANYPGGNIVFEVPTGDAVTATVTYTGIEYDGLKWSATTSTLSYTQTVSGTLTPSSVLSTTSTTSTPSNGTATPPDIPKTPPTPTPGSGSQTGKVVWQSTTGTGEGGTATLSDLLDKETFKQGVDALNKTLTDFQTTTPSNPQTDEEAQSILASLLAKAGTLTYSGPTETTGLASGITAPTSATTDDFGSWSFSGHTIHLGLGAAIAGVMGPADALLRGARILFLLGLGYAFITSCSGTLNQYIIGATQLPQVTSSENESVLGNSPGTLWSDIKGVASATAIVTAIIVFYGVVVVLINSGLLHTLDGMSIGGIEGTTLSAMQLDLTLLGPAGQLLERYFPFVAFLELSVFRLCFPFIVGPLYLTLAGLVRFARV